MKQQATSHLILRHFLRTFLPLAALVSGILGGIYFGEVKADRTTREIDEVREVDLQAKSIASDFEAVVSDLMFLASMNETQALLKDSTDESKTTLARDFFIFAQQKHIYDQIRVLDTQGKEVVRVNFNSGQPKIVPENELQSQQKRYYFKDTFRLKQGEVFVSPFDLNIERGKIEQPLKPTIRFGTPIFDMQGQKQGILVLNYLGRQLINNMKQASSHTLGDSILLNSSGYWLKSVNPGDEWRFMYPNQQNHTFGNAFPVAWEKIAKAESGQFQTAEGLFTFTTVYPLLEGQKSSTGASGAFKASRSQLESKSYYWKIVTRVSPSVLQATSQRFLGQLLLLYAGLLLLLGIGSFWMAWSSMSRHLAEAKLRQSQLRLLELSENEDLLKSRLASQIRNSLELDVILSTAVNEVGQMLQIHRCYFFWYEKDSFQLSHEVYFSNKLNLTSPGLLQVVEVLGETLLKLKGLRVDDISTASHIDNDSRNLLISIGCISVLAVLVHTYSGRMGVIVCEHQHLRPWSDQEVEFLQEVADHLAIAIDQAELYAQSRATAAVATAQAEQLEKALNQLHQTQSQLIQTEKMSSLGQLVAGVAHEINNPVNFIYGNLTHVSDYTKDLLELVHLYQNHYPIPILEIQEYIEEIDLDFLVKDLPKTLFSMKVGAERIRDIILTLRNFSRLDEAEMKLVNIHEGLDSTLLILSHRLKAKVGYPAIQIVKEYGNVPVVECYAGQLNQVFMNVLSNAIDALENLRTEEQECKFSQNVPPTITIRTQAVNDYVAVQIADNGSGMTEEVKAKLFDPFFTTKQVGQGTGLGLSISYQIVVQKHGGELWCKSALGQGTEFWIEIPVRQSHQIKSGDQQEVATE